MDAVAALHELLGADGATLPLVLVGIALGVVGMALYTVILMIKRKGS